LKCSVKLTLKLDTKIYVRLILDFHRLSYDSKNVKYLIRYQLRIQTLFEKDNDGSYEQAKNEKQEPCGPLISTITWP
jgi:hypothetical protein